MSGFIIVMISGLGFSSSFARRPWAPQQTPQDSPRFGIAQGTHVGRKRSRQAPYSQSQLQRDKLQRQVKRSDRYAPVGYGLRPRLRKRKHPKRHTPLPEPLSEKKKKKKAGPFKRFRQVIYALTAFSLLAPGTKDMTPGPIVDVGPGNPNAPVIVIHSGMGDEDNIAGRDLSLNIQHLLRTHGIYLRNANIIVLDNAYPDLQELRKFELTEAEKLFSKNGDELSQTSSLAWDGIVGMATDRYQGTPQIEHEMMAGVGSKATWVLIAPSLEELGGNLKKVPEVLLDGWGQGLENLANGKHLYEQPPLIWRFLQSLNIYRQSGDPESSVIKEQYAQMRTMLEEHGLTEGRVILVAHSAGGEVFSSMTELNDTQTNPVDIRALVMLGSPLHNDGQHNIPSHVRVVSATSKQDGLLNVIDAVQNWTGVALTQRHPDNLDDNDIAIDHDSCGHMALSWNYGLMSYIVQALRSDQIKGYRCGDVTKDGLTVSIENGQTIARTKDGITFVNGINQDSNGQTYTQYQQEHPHLPPVIGPNWPTATQFAQMDGSPTTEDNQTDEQVVVLASFTPNTEPSTTHHVMSITPQSSSTSSDNSSKPPSMADDLAESYNFTPKQAQSLAEALSIISAAKNNTDNKATLPSRQQPSSSQPDALTASL